MITAAEIRCAQGLSWATINRLLNVTGIVIQAQCWWVMVIHLDDLLKVSHWVESLNLRTSSWWGDGNKLHRCFYPRYIYSLKTPDYVWVVILHHIYSLCVCTMFRYLCDDQKLERYYTCGDHQSLMATKCPSPRVWRRFWDSECGFGVRVTIRFRLRVQGFIFDG